MKAPVIFVVWDLRETRGAVGWTFDELEAEEVCNTLRDKAGNQWAYQVEPLEPIGEKSEIVDWRR